MELDSDQNIRINEMIELLKLKYSKDELEIILVDLVLSPVKRKYYKEMEVINDYI